MRFLDRCGTYLIDLLVKASIFHSTRPSTTHPFFFLRSVHILRSITMDRFTSSKVAVLYKLIVTRPKHNLIFRYYGQECPKKSRLCLHLRWVSKRKVPLGEVTNWRLLLRSFEIRVNSEPLRDKWSTDRWSEILEPPTCNIVSLEWLPYWVHQR